MAIFDGQVAIVTGAGAGMGREHALYLAQEGAAVLVNDVSPAAQKTVDDIVARGGRAVASFHDVSIAGQVSEMVELALTKLGGLHIVISNAGIIRFEEFTSMTLDSFDRIMKVNAYGTFNLLQAAWPHLVAQDYGRVVVVSSTTAWSSQPSSAHYAASKGAVLGLAQSLAAEGAEHNITVNVLSPAAFTQMAGDLPEKLKREMETLLAPRFVAPVVAWMVLPSNTRSGEIIEAGSGRVARTFVASTRGYWNEDLSLQDIIDNSRHVDDESDYRILRNTAEFSQWMMFGATGWNQSFLQRIGEDK